MISAIFYSGSMHMTHCGSFHVLLKLRGPHLAFTSRNQMVSSICLKTWFQSEAISRAHDTVNIKLPEAVGSGEAYNKSFHAEEL